MDLIAESAIPLYKQLEEALLLRIEAGEFDKTGKLPSEFDLADKYGVSIITSRRAVSELVERGLVEKKQGKGTFVTKPKFKKNLQTVISFSDACRMSGMTPSSKTLECKKILADEMISKRLGLKKENEMIIVLTRIRYADDEPIAVETNQFPDSFSFLLDEDMNNRELIKTIKEKKSLEVYHTRRELTIIRATPEDANHLKVTKGFPLLKITSTSYDRSENILFCGLQLINCDRFQIIV